MEHDSFRFDRLSESGKKSLQNLHAQQQGAARKRRKMNVVGPILVSVSIILNVWTVLVYFVFPYTDLIIVNYQVAHEKSMVAHYILAAIYFLLLLMTIWSYLAARCSEPGYVPTKATEYNIARVSERDRTLWEYLKRHQAFKRLQDELQAQQEA